jgi:hypothetical protein
MPKDVCFSGAGCRVTAALPRCWFRLPGDPQLGSKLGNCKPGWEMPFAASAIQNTSIIAAIQCSSFECMKRNIAHSHKDLKSPPFDEPLFEHLGVSLID